MFDRIVEIPAHEVRAGDVIVLSYANLVVESIGESEKFHDFTFIDNTHHEAYACTYDTLVRVKKRGKRNV